MRLVAIADAVANQSFLERSLTQNGFQVDIAQTDKAVERKAPGGNHATIIFARR